MLNQTGDAIPGHFLHEDDEDEGEEDLRDDADSGHQSDSGKRRSAVIVDQSAPGESSLSLPARGKFCLSFYLNICALIGMS